MTLLRRQPHRALVVLVLWLAGSGLAAVGLVLWRGPLLGGLLATALALALTVPASVVAHRSRGW